MTPERIAKVCGISIGIVKDALLPQPSLDHIINSTQAEQAFINAREGTLLKRGLMIKWSDFFTLAEQAKKASAYTLEGSESARILAKKWDELSSKEVESSNTFQQALDAYNNSRKDSEPERHAVLKCLSICPIEELNATIKRFNENFDIDNEVFRLIIQRLAEILDEEAE